MCGKILTAKKIRGQLSVLPSNLEIYLTNKCNLNCSYCSSSSLINKSAQSLTFAQVKQAIDLFVSYINPETIALACGDIKKIRTIGLTGGEPFLEFDLLKNIVDYVFLKYKWLQISVATNGTLLNKKKVKFLLDRNVDLAISLDGVREITDRHRKFKDRAQSSVFNVVMENIKLLPSEYISKMRIMTTFSPDTVNSLSESVEFLSGLGFSAIEVDFDMYAMWSKKDNYNLRNALKKLKKFHIKRFSNENWIDDWKVFMGSFQNKIMNFTGYDFFNEFAFALDGKFYPIDIPDMFDVKNNGFIIGDAEKGIDFNKMKGIYDKALDFVINNKCSQSIVPQANRYFYAVLSGKNPLTFLQNSCEMTKVFKEEMSFLIEIEKIFGSFVREGEFGDFVHKPKYYSNKEMKTLILNADNLKLGLARNALDYFLYSRGKEKKLRVKSKSVNGFFNAQSAILYSALKSRYLKKNVSIYFDFRRDLNDDQIEFFRACGVKTGFYD